MRGQCYKDALFWGVLLLGYSHFVQWWATQCDLQWLDGLMKLESWWRLIVSFVAAGTTAGTAMVFLVKLGEALELRDSFWGVLLQGRTV